MPLKVMKCTAIMSPFSLTEYNKKTANTCHFDTNSIYSCQCCSLFYIIYTLECADISLINFSSLYYDQLQPLILNIFFTALSEIFITFSSFSFFKIKINKVRCKPRFFYYLSCLKVSGFCLFVLNTLSSPMFLYFWTLSTLLYIMGA